MLALHGFGFSISTYVNWIKNKWSQYPKCRGGSLAAMHGGLKSRYSIRPWPWVLFLCLSVNQSNGTQVWLFSRMIARSWRHLGYNLFVACLVISFASSTERNTTVDLYILSHVAQEPEFSWPDSCKECLCGEASCAACSTLHGAGKERQWEKKWPWRTVMTPQRKHEGLRLKLPKRINIWSWYRASNQLDEVCSNWLQSRKLVGPLIFGWEEFQFSNILTPHDLRFSSTFIDMIWHDMALCEHKVPPNLMVDHHFQFFPWKFTAMLGYQSYWLSPAQAMAVPNFTVAHLKKTICRHLHTY